MVWFWVGLFGPMVVVSIVFSVMLHRVRKNDLEQSRQAAANLQNPDPGANPSTGAGTNTGAVSAEGTGPGVEVIERADPIRAWKYVYLDASHYTVRLESGYTSSPIKAEGYARCKALSSTYPHSTRLPINHTVPHPDCSCGWYAMVDRSQLESRSTASDGSIPVVAEVDLYGDVIEGSNDIYRAQYQRILAVLVSRRDGLCRGGFLCSDTPEMLDFPPTNEARNARRTMRPVCRKHAGENSVELSQLAARLGVEVRWDDEARKDSDEALR